ncbi:MAG: hypothetical protein MZV64_10330 [Ignavibacteriales bacterium]|nr:hypothetical protein [Ignavibacteriales bacterium]
MRRRPAQVSRRGRSGQSVSSRASRSPCGLALNPMRVRTLGAQPASI